jgi:adenine-specific DNA-methyltransferase
MAKNQAGKTVETLLHEEATRKNIPTAEYQSVMEKGDQSPVCIAYERRNRDLDPQLVWRGKDEQDWSDVVVQAPPLYIQEKVHPKVLIDDLLKQTRERRDRLAGEQPDLFADFNGIPEGVDRTDFYHHDQNWSNRMILGDSLQVMASLAEREGLRGRVQCIYIDPPYGIKFNSNFQWSTTSRDVKDGNVEHITREPEQVKAFRDTWRHGIHSYLTYLRDRLTVARDLLTESGSIFVQIGDENVHRLRDVLDEIFGEQNFVSSISYKTSIGLGSEYIDNTCNYLLWYCKDKTALKFRSLFRLLEAGKEGASRYKKLHQADLRERPATQAEIAEPAALPQGARLFRDQGLTSRSASATTIFPLTFQGQKYEPASGGWRTSEVGMGRVIRADRILKTGQTLSYRKYFDDFQALALDNFWSDVSGGITSRADPKIYVVQTAAKIIERCVLMTSNPGDLVLDPTCGAGTTAYVAEQWGRRWITIDTSRVALALARTRIMGARYPYYLLADSPEGQSQEAKISRTAPSSQPTHGDIRQGFVYQRVPHITLKSIANNAELDVIWEKLEDILEPLRRQLNAALGKHWEEWEIPRESGEPWNSGTQRLFFSIRREQKRVKGNTAKIQDYLNGINHNLKRDYTLETLPGRPVDPWPEEPTNTHAKWWEARIARQKEMDASIAAKAGYEYLYDKPYDDNKKVRVAGPLTVESLSPHRVLAVDENDELIESSAASKPGDGDEGDFVRMILENLRMAGVQQAHKEDKINFTSLVPWPGYLICAESRYIEGGGAESGKEKRAAIFIGPEFGTVSRPDLVEAAREAGDADFDVLITCAFNYDARSSDFKKLGRIPVLKARMNADLHMADDLKNTGKGNLFVIFGEPDIEIIPVEGLNGDDGQIQVKVNGVDVFHPNTGEVRSDNADGIACWFIDTDYNEESFFVRHAYFLGANDPYKSLKTTLKAEINEEAWATLNSDTSRSFDKPSSGRIAVKVINHLGDEVMKVFRVN